MLASDKNVRTVSESFFWIFQISVHPMFVSDQGLPFIGVRRDWGIQKYMDHCLRHWTQDSLSTASSFK